MCYGKNVKFTFVEKAETISMTIKEFKKWTILSTVVTFADRKQLSILLGTN